MVNQAIMPQTLRTPYWQSYLDMRLLKETEQQLFCVLSYGSRIDQDLLKKVTKIVLDLGESRHVRRGNKGGGPPK
jgi:hypothetical protein